MKQTHSRMKTALISEHYAQGFYDISRLAELFLRESADAPTKQMRICTNPDPLAPSERIALASFNTYHLLGGPPRPVHGQPGFIDSLADFAQTLVNLHVKAAQDAAQEVAEATGRALVSINRNGIPDAAADDLIIWLMCEAMQIEDKLLLEHMEYLKPVFYETKRVDTTIAQCSQYFRENTFFTFLENGY
jgi:hypothetical protein